MPCRTLTSNDITVVVTAFPEEIPVKGNAICSGDEAFDRGVESDIVKRLEMGDIWAWATVCVTGSWEGLTMNQYLGCCCYESEEDFRNNSGYFEEMVDQAITSLNTRLQGLYERMSV